MKASQRRLLLWSFNTEQILLNTKQEMSLKKDNASGVQVAIIFM